MVIFSFIPDNFLIIAPYEEENISGLWSRKESENNSYYIIDAEGDRLLFKMYPIDQDNILAVILDENDREALATALFARNKIDDWGREQKPNLLGKWYAFTRFFIERDEDRQITLKTLRDYWEKGEEHQSTDFVWEFQSENVLITCFPEDDEETAIWEIDEETGLLFLTWKDGYREGNTLRPVDENMMICVSQEVGLEDSDYITVWTLIRVRYPEGENANNSY